jgi:hypothetical protein
VAQTSLTGYRKEGTREEGEYTASGSNKTTWEILVLLRDYADKSGWE